MTVFSAFQVLPYGKAEGSLGANKRVPSLDGEVRARGELYYVMA